MNFIPVFHKFADQPLAITYLFDYLAEGLDNIQQTNNNKKRNTFYCYII